LAMLAMAAGASRFPGFSRWIYAAHDDSAPQVKAPYQPQFFTPPEYRVIDQLTELIIPRDESPGARDAGVSEFIDFMIAHDVDLQPRFRSGLRWLDEHGFTGQQTELLTRIAYRKHFVKGEEEGQSFFKLLRRYTVMGYYTTRIGLEQLNYPGLHFYSSSPGCPHKNDPEHNHLPPPQV